ncbi:MAG: M28 family metallopeptidase [Isosphaeraceae bacterium]
MRRCGIGLVFLVSSQFWTALAQNLPPTGQTLHADTGRSAAGAVSSPIGFAPGSRAIQLAAEARALTVPTPENARKWLKTITAEPHVAGTQADYKTAVFVRDRLQEWGWKADLVSYEVLLNYPIGKTSRTGKTSLQINRPMFKELELDEAPLPTDKDSASSNAFGAFHGYGTSGKASGQVVYVNYARPEDFTALEKLGITVKDKIVLARYGGNFRGLKVFNAQKHGARGILIYSDPGDDGYAKGDVYPAGPYRPGSAIQRGSVQFLSHGPGDPSTPRGPSVKNADRLPVDSRFGFPLDFAGDDPMFQPSQISVKDWEAKTGLKRQDYFAAIPSLPISYDTAREIFQVLAGPNVPSGWQGGLPLAYHVGPGPAEVEFSITMDYQLRTIWNVIATIPESVEPDHWIMVGNHRDAWVYGAVDPGSGTAATLEMCRAIGEAVKNGWKPRRTLVYASWDAEEYGLVGSTEWAEEHASTVDQKVALLLNVDSAVSGRELDMGGVPSLRDLALDAAGAINDVRTGRSLRELWIDAKRTAWAAASPLNLSDPIWDNAAHGSLSDGGKLRRRGFTAQMHPLGSGSDYTVFLDHLGIPALDIGFSGSYGVYHSIYDDFTWMEKFGDPEFLTHTMAARLYTVLAMRAAAAEVLPLRFVPYGEALRDHVDELRLIRARQIRGKLDVPGQAGPQSPDAAETSDGFSALVGTVRAFQSRAAELDMALDGLAGRDAVSPRILARINDSLTRVERSFLLPGGLAGRPWFKHAVYAPGVTTGYGAWPLPAIRQALEENKPEQLKSSIDQTVAALDRATAALDKVMEEVKGASTASNPAR